MSFDEMMENISNTLRTAIDYDLLSFCIIENQRRLIIKIGVPKHIEGLEEGVSLKGMDSARSAPWMVIKKSSYLICEDFSEEREYFAESRALLDFGIQSILIVPLIVKNHVTGTFNLGSKKKANYNKKDAVFLQQIADHLAVCFENARLYGEESKIKTEWEDTFKAVTDIIYLIDTNFQMVRFNQAATDLGISIGIKPEINKLCYSFFSEHGQKCENCPAKRAFTSGKTNLIRSYSRFSRIWDGCAYPIFNAQGQIDRVILVVRNVTKRVQIEEQLIQSAKLADIGIITAGIAHELNSPLTAIIGDALLLEQNLDTFSKEQQELLIDIRKCGIRCKDIISAVRDFARKDKFSFEPINIIEVVREALKLTSYLIEKNHIRLICRLSQEPVMVMASRQHLEQLLVNLLLNARDAVKDSCQPWIEVCVGSDSEEKAVEVSVQDNGCGMHPEEITNIFNAFYTTKLVSEGTGLGLSISKRIAEEHDGYIKVSSIKGQGSLFTLVLPKWEGRDLDVRQAENSCS
jgi:two-component system NtrC family sensor kinase